MPNEMTVGRVTAQTANALMHLLSFLFERNTEWLEDHEGAKVFIEHAFPDGNVPKRADIVWDERVIAFSGDDGANLGKFTKLLKKEGVPYLEAVDEQGHRYTLTARQDLEKILDLTTRFNVDVSLRDIKMSGREDAAVEGAVSHEETVEGVDLYRIKNPDNYFNYSTVENTLRQNGVQNSVVSDGRGGFFLYIKKNQQRVDKATGEVSTVDCTKKAERVIHELYDLCRIQKARDTEYNSHVKLDFLKAHADTEVRSIENLSQDALMYIRPLLLDAGIGHYTERNINGAYRLVYDAERDRNYAERAIIAGILATESKEYSTQLKEQKILRRAAFDNVKHPDEVTFFADALDENKLYRVDKNGLAAIENGRETMIAKREENHFIQQVHAAILDQRVLMVKHHDAAELSKKAIAQQVEETQKVSDVFDKLASLRAIQTLGVLYSDAGLLGQAAVCHGYAQRLASTSGSSRDESALSAEGKSKADDLHGQLFEGRDNREDARTHAENERLLKKVAARFNRDGNDVYVGTRMIEEEELITANRDISEYERADDERDFRPIEDYDIDDKDVIGDSRFGDDE